MRIHWIRFVNIATYADTRIDFGGRELFAVIGTNGIGKTHLIQALALLLWGKKVKGKKSYTLYDVMSWGALDCMVEGEFTHMGVRYYAYRSAKTSKTGKSKASKASLFRCKGPHEINPEAGDDPRELLAGDSTADFDEKVKATFGSLEVFLACVLAAQKGAGDLLEADRADRYNVFAQMTGASALLEVGELAKNKLKDVWNEVSACNGTASLLRTQAGDPEQVRAELELGRARLAEFEQTLAGYAGQREALTKIQAELQEKVRAYETAWARVDQLLPEQQRLRLRVQELRRGINEAAQAKAELSTLEAWIRKLREAEATLEALRETDKAWGLLSQEIEQKTRQNAAEAAAITEAERQALADVTEAALIDLSLPEFAQWAKAQQDAVAAEAARTAAYTAVCTEVYNLTNDLATRRSQSALAASAPQPAGLCRSCALVSHALAMQDGIPEAERNLAETTARRAAAPPPIQIPFYNKQAHDQAQARRIQLGDVATRQAALGPRKHSLKLAQYELEDLKEKLEAMAYDPQRKLEAEQAVSLYKDAPQKKAVSDTVSVKLPELERQHAEEEKRLAEVEAELGQLRKDYGEAIPEELAGNLASTERELAEAATGAARVEKDRTWLLGSLGGLEATLAKSLELTAEAERYEGLRERWNAKHTRLTRLKAIFSKTGVLPMIIRQAAPEIERLCGEMLTQVWPTLGMLRIVTDDGKGGEIIDLFVEDDKGLHPIDLYSGGEEQVLRIVLRMAIGRWRAMKSGQTFDMISFDEAFDALAPENAGKVIHLLRGMLDFVKQVMVISHTDDTVLEFDDKLVLTREGGGVRAAWRE